MAKPIIENAKDNSKVMWQNNDEGLAEAALLIENYSDCIIVTQEESAVRINYDTVDELCKLLKSLKPS